MKTVEQAARDMGISKKLINAVLRQLGGGKEAKESLGDVARHGAAGGFGGFTYYTDTVAFFKRNKKDILALVEQRADDFGEEPVKMVTGFGTFKHDAPGEIYPSVARVLYGTKVREDDIQVANALAWFALEEVAQAFEE